MKIVFFLKINLLSIIFIKRIFESIICEIIFSYQSLYENLFYTYLFIGKNNKSNK